MLQGKYKSVTCRLQLFRFRCTISHLVGESADLRLDNKPPNGHTLDSASGSPTAPVWLLSQIDNMEMYVSSPDANAIFAVFDISWCVYGNH